MTSINPLADIKAALAHNQDALPKLRGTNKTSLQKIITSLQALITALGG